MEDGRGSGQKLRRTSCPICSHISQTRNIFLIRTDGDSALTLDYSLIEDVCNMADLQRPIPSTQETSASQPNPLPPNQGPRLVLYAQTLDRDGKRISLLPLLTEHTGVTHVIIGCLHLHDRPGVMRLNDHDPNDKRFDPLWGEVKWLQGAGTKVLLMIGGASQGSFKKLGGDDTSVRFSCCRI